MFDFILILPILIPFITGLLILLIKPNVKKTEKYIMFTVIVNFIITAYTSFIYKGLSFHILKFNNLLDIYLAPDTLGSIFAMLVSVLWIFTTFYSFDYMSHEHNLNRFYAFFIMTLGITLGIAFSGNLITLYIFYEMLTLCTFPLVIHSDTEEALKCGRKYLLYSFIGAAFVLFGIIIFFSQTGNLDFTAGGIVKLFNNSNKNYFLMSYIFFFIGFGVKAALVPFHSWLPSAMVAPTPVSSLLHAVAVVKSGVFSLTRMTYYIFGWKIIEQTGGNDYMLVFVLLTILMGSFLALHQQNLKKRLAYSTISQLGYIMLGLVVFSENAFIGGMLHMLFHAMIKITLFFCVGAIMHYYHKTEISEIEGIGKSMPKTMICFTIASISLIGIPPANGFVSKWYLAIGGLELGAYFVPIILLLSALLTAGYLIPVITTAFFKGPPSSEVDIKEPGNLMLMPIIVLTCISVITGFFPNLLISVLQKASSVLF